jgi:GT2 family glycosyltransferase
MAGSQRYLRKLFLRTFKLMRVTSVPTRGEANRVPVSVVIVNYNSGRYLVGCVKSVLNTRYSRKEVIVVDNASCDGSVAEMLDAFPRVKVVRNTANVGYAAAVNLGISSAKGEFVVIMNPDTIVDSDWLGNLVSATSRHPSGAFFQPKILLMDDQRVLNSAGNMIHLAGFGVCRGLGRLDSEYPQQESEIGYASGACTLIRRKALRGIGPMEEMFFAYGEDKDWGWRASMLGWQSIYVPSAKVLHKWSSTLGQTARKFYLLEFERVLSISKNYSKQTLLVLTPVVLVVEWWVLFHAIINGWLGEKLQSYVDLFHVRDRVLQKRQIVQEHRIVSDRVLIRTFITAIEHPYLGPAASVLNQLLSRMQSLLINSI